MSALEIRIGWNGGAIDRVELRSHRPDTSRLLPGRTPDEALALLGRLYAVCGHAQRAAAELALCAALGRAPAAGRPAELLCACTSEAVQEHLWRLLVDWPKKLGLSPQQDRFAHWYRRCSVADGSWPADLLAELAADWLACPVADLETWSDLRTCDAWSERAEPTLAPLFRQLHSAAAVPARAGAAPAADETGPVAQHAEHPWVSALLGAGREIEARVAARLVGLVALAGNFASGCDPDRELDFDADAPGAGRGRAVVTTARGLLVHEVEVEAGRIASYRIQTPTDRNFASDGAYVAHVEGVPAGTAAAAARCADLWALALDPCVPYRIDVVERAAHA